MASLALRVLVVGAALGAGYFALSHKSAQDKCDDAGQRVFASSGGFEPLAGLDDAIEVLRRECTGASGLMTAAETLRRASEQRPELAERAVDLAREATRIEPENYITWATLAQVYAPIDEDAARASLTRARELNPKLETPPALAPRRSARR